MLNTKSTENERNYVDRLSSSLDQLRKCNNITNSNGPVLVTHEEFNKELFSATCSEDCKHFTKKHILHGTPIIFQGQEEKYFDFRNRVAKHFDIEYKDVLIVGSAKLGFNYFTGKEFSFDSDVDVVLVNEQLFEKYFQSICAYQYQLDKNFKAINSKELNMYRQFLQYLVKGWMRPDKLPVSFEIELLKIEWFDFFSSISHGRSEAGNYKINAGLFKSQSYLEKYYSNGVEEHHYQLKMNKENETNTGKSEQ